jgi:hypothetical protein
MIKKWLLGLAAVALVAVGVCTYLWRGAQNTRDSAVAFAEKALERLTAEWEVDEFFGLAAPELRRRASRDRVAEKLAGFREKLGRVRTLELASWNVSRHYSGGTATMKATLSLNGEFERGSARVELILLRGEYGQWAVGEIRVFPE